MSRRSRLRLHVRWTVQGARCGIRQRHVLVAIALDLGQHEAVNSSFRLTLRVGTVELPLERVLFESSLACLANIAKTFYTAQAGLRPRRRPSVDWFAPARRLGPPR